MCGYLTLLIDAELRQRLNKIMSSEYFTTTPEMTAPVDVAAASAGNFGSYPVPAQEPNINSQGEGNVTKYDQQVQNLALNCYMLKPIHSYFASSFFEILNLVELVS